MSAPGATDSKARFHQLVAALTAEHGCLDREGSIALERLDRLAGELEALLERTESDRGADLADGERVLLLDEVTRLRDSLAHELHSTRDAIIDQRRRQRATSTYRQNGD